MADDNVVPENSSGNNESSRKKRSRSTSSSSSSSSSSSTSSSSSSSQDKKKSRRDRRRRRRKGKGGKRNRKDDRLDSLSKAFSELRDQLTQRQNSQHCSNSQICAENLEDHSSLVDDNVSRILYNDMSDSEDKVPFNFNLATKLKDPSVPKAPVNYLNTLKEIQHFENDEWFEVRYAETQKNYNFAPGFVELEVNDEVKSYDNLRHLVYAERAFAALTFGILKQKEVLESTLRELLLWGKSCDQIKFDDLDAKVTELFQNSNLQKVSSDLLQIVCGHRAETIQMRRDGITNAVRDPLIKSALKKIPPSCQHLFKPEPFTLALEKAGGIRKSFLPLQRSATFATTASQAATKPHFHPSQGLVPRSIPSQGLNAHGRNSHNYNCNWQSCTPSQGCCHYQHRPTQGQKANNNKPVSYGNKNNFRSRTGHQSRYDDTNKPNRKRNYSPVRQTSNKKKRF